MADAATLKELEEIITCDCCKQKFNSADRPPKLLSCNHYFCLSCIHLMMKGNEVICIRCCLRTQLAEQWPETLPTYSTNMKLAQPKPPEEEREIQVEILAILKLLQDSEGFFNKRKGCLVRVLESCNTLKTHIESELQKTSECMRIIGESRDFLTTARVTLSQLENPMAAQPLFTIFNKAKQRLQAKVQNWYFQSQLNDLICNSTVVFDFTLLKQALTNIHTMQTNTIPYRTQTLPPTPLLFLTNYCMSQLYTRQMVSQQQHILQNQLTPYEMSFMPDQQQSLIDVTRPSYLFPLFYFNIEVDGQPRGRIVIATRPDVAPKMSKNFADLSTGERGISYEGCKVFGCWERTSILTGDVVLKNGRGGRSIYKQQYFMPDCTQLPTNRGAVAMRLTKSAYARTKGKSGLVGAHFAVFLRPMPGFIGVFGHLVEGIELVEKIAALANQFGRPTETVVIVKCGKL